MFSKEFIKHRTRFGPLQAPREKSHADRRSSNIARSTTAGRLEFCLFKGSRTTDRVPVICLNTALGNEDSCNWMVLVAPARNHDQQNLVAFQYNAAIYFVTTKVSGIVYTKWNELYLNICQQYFNSTTPLIMVHLKMTLWPISGTGEKH